MTQQIIYRTILYFSGDGEEGTRLSAHNLKNLNSFEQKDIDKFNDILEHLYKMIHNLLDKQ